MTADFLAGLIWAMVMGWCMGHFATTFIYRLPRGLPVAAEKPYCDHCRAWLEVRDLFPVFSYLLNRGKCRSCSKPIPSDYFWIELLAVIGFALLFLWLGFGENFLILSMALTALLALLSMIHLSRYWSPHALVILAICGAVLVALRDKTVLDALLAAALLGFFGFAIGQRHARPSLSAETMAMVGGVLGLWLVYLLP